MNRLLAHRGPDGEGIWIHDRGHVGFAHRRLEIIDLDDRRSADAPTATATGSPTTARSTTTSSCASELGERALPHDVRHRGRAARLPALGRRLPRAAARHVRLRALGRGGADSSSARATASASSRSTTRRSTASFYFASEAKALLPFLPSIETDLEALKDYLTFQFCLAGKTLFKGVQRAAARPLRCIVRNGDGARCGATGRSSTSPTSTTRERYFDGRGSSELVRGLGAAAPARRRAGRRLRLAAASTRASSPALAAEQAGDAVPGVHRPLRRGPERYDESRYARDARRASAGFELHEVDDRRRATSSTNIREVIYHLDYPVAGPGLVPAVHGLEARRAARARSCSAARAATRSSAATPAT